MPNNHSPAPGLPPVNISKVLLHITCFSLSLLYLKIADISCNFESGNLCGWTIDTGWEIQKDLTHMQISNGNAIYISTTFPDNN